MGGTEVSFPGLGIHVNVDPVAFTLFGLEVYWYGIIISLGVVLCATLGFMHCKKNKFSSDLICDILLVSLPSAIVGARLYYVVSKWSYYSANPKEIFDLRGGGLAVYGGVLAAYLGAYIMCRIRKIPFATCADYCICYIPLGQAIGRWGNFVNQEAFGTTTTLPWGMTSSEVVSYLKYNCPDLDSSMPVHPTFLYESLFNFGLVFLLLYVRKRSKHCYETTATYMVCYGIIRFLIEGLRTDSLYIGDTGIRTSQLLSLILVIAGLLIVIYVRSKKMYRVDLPERFLVAEGIIAPAEEVSSEEVSVEEAQTVSEVVTEESNEKAEIPEEDKKEE